MEHGKLFLGMIPTSMLKDRSVVGKRRMDNRRSHGLIIKLEGKTEYCTPGCSWMLGPGQILFVAKDASYEIREVEPGYSYVVNFESQEPVVEQIFLLPTGGAGESTLAERMYHSWQKQDVWGAMSSLYALLGKHLGSREPHYSSSRERQLLEPAMVYLKEHLTDPELELCQLSRLAGVSDAYLRRVFKRQHGVGPSAYVIRERMRMASALLESGERNIAAVALQVGYRDALYFSRLFKKQTGISPSRYSRERTEDLF